MWMELYMCLRAQRMCTGSWLQRPLSVVFAHREWSERQRLSLLQRIGPPSFRGTCEFCDILSIFFSHFRKRAIFNVETALYVYFIIKLLLRLIFFIFSTFDCLYIYIYISKLGSSIVYTVARRVAANIVIEACNKYDIVNSKNEWQFEKILHFFWLVISIATVQYKWHFKKIVYLKKT